MKDRQMLRDVMRINVQVSPSHFDLRDLYQTGAKQAEANDKHHKREVKYEDCTDLSYFFIVAFASLYFKEFCKFLEQHKELL